MVIGGLEEPRKCFRDSKKPFTENILLSFS